MQGTANKTAAGIRSNIFMHICLGNFVSAFTEKNNHNRCKRMQKAAANSEDLQVIVLKGSQQFFCTWGTISRVFGIFFLKRGYRLILVTCTYEKISEYMALSFSCCCCSSFFFFCFCLFAFSVFEALLSLKNARLAPVFFIDF